MRQPTKHGKKKTKVVKTKRKVHRQKYGTSKLETFFAQNYLDKLELNYVYEYEAEDIKRFFDFAVVATMPNTEIVYVENNGIISISQKKNMVRPILLFEVDGGYYHNDPRVVDESKLNPMQKHNKFVDGLKNEWCEKHHIPLLRIWEYDIHNNPLQVMKSIKETLEKLSTLEQSKARIHRPHPKNKIK